MSPSLKTAPCAFLSFRDDGTIEWVNDKFLDLVGHDRGDVIGAHVETILTVGARLFYHTHFFPMLKMKGEVEEVYLSLRANDDTDVPCLLNAQRVEQDAERTLNQVTLFRCSERNQYEEEILQAKRAAEKANEAKEKFLSTVSHELRTPLSTIRMITALLQDEAQGPVTDDQSEALARIEEAVEYLDTLTSDMLDFARMDAGDVNLEIDTVPVSDLVERARSMFGPQFKRKDLAFDVDLSDDDPHVRADPDRVQQILLNLLTNAVKFTNRGGQIGVDVSSTDDAARITVWDTGVGIPDDEQETVFTPFAQVSDPTEKETESGGVGLGLAISRTLARRMDGDLTVDSEEGRGSAFTLELPRVRVKTAAG